MKERIKGYIRDVIYPVPTALRQRRIPHTKARIDKVRTALELHYFKGVRKQQSPEAFAWDMNNHLTARMDGDRRNVIPWLNSVMPLAGKRILELGCGTGASTIALAEQGAAVTAVDLEGDDLEVARVRVEAYGVTENVTIRYANAVQVLEETLPGSYDMILFFACLEHMTHLERMSSLKRSWALLPKGGILAIVETPNRLWYYDSHTSLSNCFHWLPDDLAFRYSRYSPRKGFNDVYREPTPAAIEHFFRRGRGASFHEFDVAIGPSAEMKVHSLREFQLPWSWLRKSSRDRLYTRFMRKLYPKLHSGWFDEYLDLMIIR